MAAVSEWEMAQLRNLGAEWDKVMADIIFCVGNGDIETAENASIRLVEIDTQIQHFIQATEKQLNSVLGRGSYSFCTLAH